MAEKKSQTYHNHARLNPPYHFFLLPVAAITLLWACWNLYDEPRWQNVALLIRVIAVCVSIFLIRTYALKVQDRVIRLEGRLRLSGLLDDPWKLRIGELTESQLIALRFASDAEIPVLVP